MRQFLDPLSADEWEHCIRWAYVWFALAAKARQAGRWDWAERMTDAGEDVFISLEAFYV